MTRRIRSLALAVGLAGLLLSCAARAQDGPSFDCGKAASRIEKLLCKDSFALGWIDRTMGDLYRTALARPDADSTAIRTAQRAWVAQRDHCTGSDDRMSACLLASYRARFIALAAPWDPAHVTGTYTAPPVNGALDAVLFPDRSLVAQIDSNTGPPAYNLCHFEIRATAEGQAFRYAEPPDDSDPTAPACKIALTPGRSSLVVEPSGCSSECGNGADIAGTYRR